MSSSDDYHRHRLRTATKYFKVSVKPFQRLVGFGATPREKSLAGFGATPREKKKKSKSGEGISDQGGEAAKEGITV